MEVEFDVVVVIMWVDGTLNISDDEIEALQTLQSGFQKCVVSFYLLIYFEVNKKRALVKCSTY